MESCGSCSGSNAPAFLANTSSPLGMMAIRDEDKSPRSSARVPSSASNQMMQEMLPFKCKLCPRAFRNARARGGHQKAHRQLGAPVKKKNRKAQTQPLAPVKKQKANNGDRPAWSQAMTFPSTYSYATALRSACLHAQPFADWCSHYDPSVLPVPLSFPFQTATGGVSPAPLSAPARREGGREQGISEENQQDESANGIDLSLKL